MYWMLTLWGFASMNWLKKVRLDEGFHQRGSLYWLTNLLSKAILVSSTFIKLAYCYIVQHLVIFQVIFRGLEICYKYDSEKLCSTGMKRLRSLTLWETYIYWKDSRLTPQLNLQKSICTSDIFQLLQRKLANGSRTQVIIRSLLTLLFSQRLLEFG